MSANLLTDKSIQAPLKAAAASAKPKKLSGGAGLYLEARANGEGWWRFRFKTNGVEGMLSLGASPDLPLKLARERRTEARAAKAAGIDLRAQRKADKAARALNAEAASLAAAGSPAKGSFE